jgi:TnpA family transposase
LLHHDTIVRPHEHFVDQHGYTDQLFGLCHLLVPCLINALAA